MITLATKLIFPEAAKEKAATAGSSLPRLSSSSKEVDLEGGKLMGDKIVVRIEVSDTGVGIAPGDAQDLFSAYVQTEVGRAQGGKGTGLGLALVRHIVKLSGGRLGVTSKKGEGSTFWVEFALGVGSKLAVAGADFSRDRTGRRQPVRPAMPKFRQGSLLRDVDVEHVYQTVNGVPYLDKRSSTNSVPKTANQDMADVDLSRFNTASIASASSWGSAPTIVPAPGSGTSVLSYASFDYGPFSGRLSPTLPATATDPSSSPSLGSTSPQPGDQSDESPTPVQAEKPVSENPVSPTTSPSSGSSPPEKEPARRLERPLNVLVVDDDPLTRQLMSRMLSRHGATVTTAEDGQSALDKLLSSPPYDCVLLDNQMPKKTGVDVVRHLRKIGSSQFVVGVTGNALSEDQAEFLGAGANQLRCCARLLCLSFISPFLTPESTVYSVLTKPVLERDLKRMVIVADELRKAASLSSASNSGGHGDDPLGASSDASSSRPP
jgi:osomolarity two-component system sensor histidine kinase SLN1